MKNPLKLSITLFFIMLFLISNVNAQSSKNVEENIKNTTNSIEYSIKENPFKTNYTQGIYPEITKADNILIKAKINTEIEQIVSNFDEYIKKKTKEGEQLTGYVNYEIKNDKLNVNTNDNNYISYDVKANNNGIFSLLITCSTMYKGAAHPSNYTYGLTFDKQGNLITLNELINENETTQNNYTVINLKKAVYTQAADKLYTGNIPVIIDKIPSEFYVDQNNILHVLFQQYEIAPYAAGVIDISL